MVAIIVGGSRWVCRHHLAVPVAAILKVIALRLAPERRARLARRRLILYANTFLHFRYCKLNFCG